MNTILNLENDTSNFFISCFCGFLLVVCLILPISQGGFSVSFLFALFVTIIFIFLDKNNYKEINYVIILWSIFAWALLSLTISSFEINSIWQIREYIRYPLLLWLVISVNIDHKLMIRIFLVCFSFVVFCDFVFLFLYPSSSIGILLKSIVSMRGMLEYHNVSYWRHIGIGGNPNVSAIIYSIYIIVGLHFFLNSKTINLFKIENMTIIIGLMLSAYLNIITYSRTGLVAQIFSLLVLVRNPIKISLITFFIFLVLFLLFQELLETLFYRFESFSSFDARIHHWDRLIDTLTFSHAIFGTSLPVSVVDNDYLYFFYRFGFFGALAFIITPFLLCWNIKDISLKKLYFGLLVFYLVAGLPGGPWTHPKTYFFLLFLGSILQQGRIKQLANYKEVTI